MNIDLTGRVAIITGATGNIGGAIAEEFWSSGATVVLNGREQEKLDALRAKLLAGASGNDRILSVNLDLTADGAEKELVARSVQKFDKVDIFVNCAAMIAGKLICKSDEQFLNTLMKLNYRKPFAITREVLPIMKKNKYGRIINISSVAGQYGDSGLAAYAGSKGALASFTKSIADEYGRYKITANCVAPGIINTEALKQMRPQYRQEMLARTPARRFGNPDEVAALCTFLASERAAFINGQEIAVNGGLYR